MAKMIGTLRAVGVNDKGYAYVDVEGFRFDAGKLDPDRLSKWEALVDREVVATVVAERRQSNGKFFIVRRVLSLRELGNGSVP